MTEHLWDTCLNRDIPVANHYDEFSHSSENMLYQIIHIHLTHAVDDRSMPKHRKYKKYWTYQLLWLLLLGLNVFEKDDQIFNHFYAPTIK